MFSEKNCVPLMINIIFVKVILTFPKAVVENSGNAAWIQLIYNTILALLFFCAVIHIYNRKKNIIEIAEINGGKTLKLIVGVIVTLVLILNAVPVIRIFPESVKTVLLQDMNTEIIVLVTAVTAALGAYLGIEALGRIHRIFLPVAAIVFLTFILMLIPHYKIVNINPVFGNGLKKIFVRGVNSLSLFSDLIILNLLIPYTKNLDVVKRSGRLAIITAGAAAVVTTAAYCLSFSYPVSENFIMPVYQMSRLVNISNFFSRFEALFEFVWSILTLLYTSTYLYMISYVLQITLSLKFLKPLIFPVTVVVFMISLLPLSMMEMMQWDSMIGSFSYIPVFALLLIFGRVWKKQKSRSQIE